MNCSKSSYSVPGKQHEIHQKIEKQCKIPREHFNTTNSEADAYRIAEKNSVSLFGHSGQQDTTNSLNVGSIKSLSEIENETMVSFEKKPYDSNTINISDLRFLDTTDSIQNLISNAEPSGMGTKLPQPIPLLTKTLEVFDSRNPANNDEVVGNYLEAYIPRIPYDGTAYNQCNEPRKEKSDIEMKTLSVSTESQPSLQSNCLEKAEEFIASKLKDLNCLVMQGVGGSPAIQSVNMFLDKDGKKPSIDMRMQKILGTIREDVKFSKSLDKSYLMKVPTKSPTRDRQDEVIEEKDSKNEDKRADFSTKQLLNTYRGCYNHKNVPQESIKNLHLLPQQQLLQQEPLPQFEALPCPSVLAQEFLLKQANFSYKNPIPASMLNIPRSPLQCPESTCQRMIFVSDFSKHLAVDHNHLPMERITPFQCKNFFLDARLFQHDTSKCHLLYLMRGKIIGLGSSEYRDFLPILVMSGRISLEQMCGRSCNQTSNVEYFLVWVTGIAAEEYPISVSLTAWSRSGRAPLCHVVYSGQMYSIRNSQSAVDVWQSGRMLLLSSQEVKALTGNFKEMLNFQLSVH